MSNFLLMGAHRQRAGLGDTYGGFTLNPLPVTSDPYFGLGPPPTMQPPSSSSSGSNFRLAESITNLINKGLDVFTANKVLNTQQMQMQLTAQQANNNDDSDSPDGETFSLGFTGKGLRVSRDTTIGYGTLVGAGIVLMLIQSKGFSRR